MCSAVWYSGTVVFNIWQNFYRICRTERLMLQNVFCCLIFWRCLFFLFFFSEFLPNFAGLCGTGRFTLLNVLRCLVVVGTVICSIYRISTKFCTDNLFPLTLSLQPCCREFCYDCIRVARLTLLLSYRLIRRVSSRLPGQTDYQAKQPLQEA